MVSLHGFPRIVQDAVLAAGVGRERDREIRQR